MPEFGTFDTLTPEVIFTAAEEAFNCRFSGVLLPLPSYINRVYEMESADRERFIIKFYRPGRWSRAALLEEHVFTLEAREAEIPVIAPLRLANGSTLGTAPDGTFFGAFPKRWGRGLEPESDAPVWRRLGALIGRLHTVGAARAAKHRIRLDPRGNTLNEVAHLLSCGVASERVLPALTSDAQAAAGALAERYRPGETIRLQRRLPQGQHPRTARRGTHADRLRRHALPDRRFRICGCCCRGPWRSARLNSVNCSPVTVRSGISTAPRSTRSSSCAPCG